jgi:hypothetical protein
MRRLLLSAWVTLLSGCFYVPAIADCAVACTDACPSGLSCVDGLCTRDKTKACECQVGVSRACGSGVGECREGRQSCENGTWGPCLGEVAASAEVCDGLDNDCDGVVDALPSRTLFEGRPLDWKLLSLDGGFALVTYEGFDDAGLERAVVRRLDAQLAQLDVTTALTTPQPQAIEAISRGSTVYVARAIDGGIDVVAVENGQLRPFASIEDAGDVSSFALGASDRVVAHWGVSDLMSTHVGRWSLDGQLQDVTNLTEVVDAGGPLDGFRAVVSDQGHYATFTATPPPDAGFLDSTLRIIVDTRTLTTVRFDAPYYQFTDQAQPFELADGTVPNLYTYIDPSSTWSGVYLNPDALTLTTDEEFTVEESRANATAWSASDGVVDFEGRVSFVYRDNEARRLVLGRTAVGSTTAPVTQPLLRMDGFGEPHLAWSGSGPFLGLAWSDPKHIEARLVCPAR